MEKNKKYLIAVSGGPDSMFLLDKYKNKNIIVARVNYNQRKDSHIDTNIVKEYCKKNNIPLEIMELKKKIIPSKISKIEQENKDICFLRKFTMKIIVIIY
ncbi:7-cyano-7-deazaguanine synthase [Mycoplasmopsis felis]|uniref:ATP-binding protein n=1 Tax=Mycoplasmopsis felis TaxID=33923 RepID=UPI0021DFA148|nr:ATP-binding protein [Mycoplasmopsis felis]MCU9937407.1 7-cyano-7-deazaguanine synthase [Mycoplasmopsis felis]